MKKLLLVGFLLLSTTACSNSNDAASMDKQPLSYNELYDTLKVSLGVDGILAAIDPLVLSDYSYDNNPDVMLAANNAIEQLKTTYGKDYDAVLKSYNAKTDQELLENSGQMLQLSQQLSLKDYYYEHYINDQSIKATMNNLPMKASHILLDPTSMSQEEFDAAKKDIEQTLSKASQDTLSKTFGELAKKYSIDGTKDQGGDLGEFYYDDMVEPFSKATKSLKYLEYTKTPVQSEYGVHYILRTDNNQAMTFEKNKEDLKRIQYEKAMHDNTSLAEYLMIKIRAEHKIEFKDPKDKAIYDDYVKHVEEDYTSKVGDLNGK